MYLKSVSRQRNSYVERTSAQVVRTSCAHGPDAQVPGGRGFFTTIEPIDLLGAVANYIVAKMQYLQFCTGNAV